MNLTVNQTFIIALNEEEAEDLYTYLTNASLGNTTNNMKLASADRQAEDLKLMLDDYM